MLKLVLGIGTLVICSLLGSLKAQKYKNEYLYYSSLRAFCKNYEANLIYGKKEVKSFLNFSYVSNDFVKTLTSFLNNSELFCPDYLSNKEVSEVLEFFNSLGVSDSASQDVLIKSYYLLFNEVEKEKFKLYQKYYSAYLKIGFSVGFMLFLVVI